MRTKEIIKELELNYGYNFNPEEKHEFDWLCNLIKDVETVVYKNESLHLVSNCYCLTEKQKKKMDKHKANEIKFSHSSGIGVSVEIKTKKGNWKDITDYSCW